eukprot:CAMPEP_0113940238 /NCGR_PEP_ID=MMETSP1339-20121228/6409_1 /TAXON_ID=94617 /ORGANISM="Fibrocapsa japonica" /LENGTH=181 /DNA_ID=CAMNT_0000943995 /DNA_START=336 /DNA_END=881 /DNA_ORIENTATION=+ /assembly_acc=CAM_ASM_000762
MCVWGSDGGVWFLAIPDPAPARGGGALAAVGNRLCITGQLAGEQQAAGAIAGSDAGTQCGAEGGVAVRFRHPLQRCLPCVPAAPPHPVFPPAAAVEQDPAGSGGLERPVRSGCLLLLLHHTPRIPRTAFPAQHPGVLVSCCGSPYVIRPFRGARPSGVWCEHDEADYAHLFHIGLSKLRTL